MGNTVCVVLSSYNGEKYISQQIESVINQKGVEVLLYVRDDGSTDNTPSILRELACKHKNIIVSIEGNLGFRKSFLKALGDAPDSQYYAFCDQDDFWFDDKLLKTIGLLNKTKSDLAFCNAWIADENLNPKERLYTKKHSIPSFPESLTNSNCHGFLFLFTKKMRDLAIRPPLTAIGISHDFWLITIASLFGKTSFSLEDNVALYRRLATSVSKKKPFKQLALRIGSLFKDIGILSHYSKVILDNYQDCLSGQQKDFLNCCAFYREDSTKKKNLLRNKKIKIKYRFKILINKY